MRGGDQGECQADLFPATVRFGPALYVDAKMGANKTSTLEGATDQVMGDIASLSGQRYDDRYAGHFAYAKPGDLLIRPVCYRSDGPVLPAWMEVTRMLPAASHGAIALRTTMKSSSSGGVTSTSGAAGHGAMSWAGGEHTLQ